MGKIYLPCSYRYEKLLGKSERESLAPPQGQLRRQETALLHVPEIHRFSPNRKTTARAADFPFMAKQATTTFRLNEMVRATVFQLKAWISRITTKFVSNYLKNTYQTTFSVSLIPSK